MGNEEARSFPKRATQGSDVAECELLLGHGAFSKSSLRSVAAAREGAC